MISAHVLKPLPEGAAVRPHVLRLRKAAAATLLITGVGIGLSACTEKQQGDEAIFCERIVQVPVPTNLDDLTKPIPEVATAPLIDALTSAREVAPAAVEPDVGAMVAAAEALRDTLVERETGQDLGAESTLNTRLDEFGRASDRVVAYTRDTCGVDLEAG